MLYELTVRGEFSAAHHLRQYKGKCEHLHGHNWQVDLSLEGDRLGAEGMLIDFTDARRILGDVLDRFDHAYLNEVPPFETVNPSSENLARVIAEAVGPRLPAGVRVAAVTTWESDRSSATYRPARAAGAKEG